MTVAVSAISPVSNIKQMQHRIRSVLRDVIHRLENTVPSKPRTRDNLTVMLQEYLSPLNLTPNEQAVEDTLGYEDRDPFPSFRIIPSKVIPLLPWRGK